MRLTLTDAVKIFGPKILQEEPVKQTKYHNKKCVWNGVEFDSKHEMDRFIILKSEEREGLITDLNRQVRFQLLPSQKDDEGKVIERPCFYIADFVYRRNGELVVEDAKGVKTKEYRLKKKMMLWFHGIRIQEV